METLPALPTTQVFSPVEFSTGKAALAELAARYADLTINGVDDAAGYAIVDEARKDLKKKRVMIKNDGKEFRQEALAFQKKVIEMEKELIEIIEPLEHELKAKQDIVDEAKRKALRLAALPARKEKLAKISFEMADDEILAMSAEEFVEFHNTKTGEYLEAREKAVKEQEAKLAREKELEAAKEQARLKAEAAAKVEAERAAKEAAEREVRLKQEAEDARIQAAKDAEEAKERAVKEAAAKAEAEKRELIESQERKEKERLLAEEKQKQEAAMFEEKKRQEQKKLEMDKKYQNFLADCGYNEQTAGEFHLVKTEAKVIIYKEIGTFKFENGGQDA